MESEVTVKRLGSSRTSTNHVPCCHERVRFSDLREKRKMSDCVNDCLLLIIDYYWLVSNQTFNWWIFDQVSFNLHQNSSFGSHSSKSLSFPYLFDFSLCLAVIQLISSSTMFIFLFIHTHCYYIEESEKYLFLKLEKSKNKIKTKKLVLASFSLIPTWAACSSLKHRLSILILPPHNSYNNDNILLIDWMPLKKKIKSAVQSDRK